MEAREKKRLQCHKEMERSVCGLYSTTVMPTLSVTLVSGSILPVHFLSRAFFFL